MTVSCRTLKADCEQIVMHYDNARKPTLRAPTTMLVGWLRNLISEKQSGTLSLTKLSIRAQVKSYIHRVRSQGVRNTPRIGDTFFYMLVPWKEQQRQEWMSSQNCSFPDCGIELDIWDAKPACDVTEEEVATCMPIWGFYSPPK